MTTPETAMAHCDAHGVKRFVYNDYAHRYECPEPGCKTYIEAFRVVMPS